MLPDAFCFFAGVPGFPVDGQVHVQDPVMLCQVGSYILAIAADLVIPGLESDDHDISSFHRGGRNITGKGGLVVLHLEGF